MIETPTILKTVRIKNLVEKLKQNIKEQSFDIDQIILFGSCAKKQFKPNSDIDICVVTEKASQYNCYDLKLERYLRDFLEEEELQLDILYITKEKLEKGNRVEKEIRKDGIVIYENIS